MTAYTLGATINLCEDDALPIFLQTALNTIEITASQARILTANILDQEGAYSEQLLDEEGNRICGIGADGWSFGQPNRCAFETPTLTIRL